MSKLECPQVQTDRWRPFDGHLGYWTKPILKLGRTFDKSNLYMKFGSNWVINDYGRVSTSAN